MGNPMAQCLIEAGHQLTVYNARWEVMVTPLGKCTSLGTTTSGSDPSPPPKRRQIGGWPLNLGVSIERN